MYQLLLVMALLLSIGGAVTLSISRGSASKAYTSLASTTYTLDDHQDDSYIDKAVRLADENPQEESLVSTVFKSIIGVEVETKASPMLTRTISGTYACTATSSVQNPPCSSPYVFIFKSNSAAVLRIENISGTATTTQVGTWEVNNDGQIVVTLFTDGQKRFDEDRKFTLLRGGRAQLITVEYPYDAYPDILTGIFKFVKK
jgi:hypothetical protein